MKKAFLFRLIALIFFCLASFAIKSETSFCKTICPYAAENKTSANIKILTGNTEEAYYKYDAFFIKI